MANNALFSETAMPSKPFLKWAGGKHKLAPFIASHMPTGRRERLVEPFCGSAAVSLALDFDAYLLGDSNPDLIALFQALVQHGQGFIDYAKSFFTPAHNTPECFYDLRERFNLLSGSEEKSALFVYLNRHAFNGLCRYNSKGQFNVPFGRYKAPYFPEREMQAFIGKSARMTLHCGDFGEVFAATQPGDVIYCDPPYVPLSQTASFTAYAANGFGMDEQKRLARLAMQAGQYRKLALISNHDTPDTRKLYEQARVQTIHVQRNIAANGNNRLKVRELLAAYGE